MQDVVNQQHKVKCINFFRKLSKNGFLNMDEETDQFLSHSINISVNIALYNLEKDNMLQEELFERIQNKENNENELMDDDMKEKNDVKNVYTPLYDDEKKDMNKEQKK